MDDNIDVERLIVEVGKVPWLWDPAHEKYKDRNEKGNAWQEICKTVYLQYEEKTEEQQAVIGKYLRIYV